MEITQFSPPEVYEIILLFLMTYALLTAFRLMVRLFDRFFDPLIDRMYDRILPPLPDTAKEETTA